MDMSHIRSASLLRSQKRSTGQQIDPCSLGPSRPALELQEEARSLAVSFLSCIFALSKSAVLTKYMPLFPRMRSSSKTQAVQLNRRGHGVLDPRFSGITGVRCKPSGELPRGSSSAAPYPACVSLALRARHPLLQGRDKSERRPVTPVRAPARSGVKASYRQFPRVARFADRCRRSPRFVRRMRIFLTRQRKKVIKASQRRRYAILPPSNRSTSTSSLVP